MGKQATAPLRAGADAFLDLLRLLGNAPMYDDVDDQREGRPLSHDFVTMNGIVGQAIRQHYIAATPEHRSGFLRGLTGALSQVADGSSPGDGWDPIAESAYSFARGVAPSAPAAPVGSKSATRKVAAQRRRDLEAGGEHVKALMDKVEALGLPPKRPGIHEDLCDIRSSAHVIRHDLLAGFEHSNEAFREGFERGLGYLITGDANGGSVPDWSKWDPITWTADSWDRPAPAAVAEIAATGAEPMTEPLEAGPSDSTSEPRPVVAGALVARELVRTLAEAAPVPGDEEGFGFDGRAWVLRDAILEHTSRQQTPADHEWGGFWLGLAGFIVPNASGAHIDRDFFDPLRLMAEEDLIQPTADAAQLVQAMPKAKPPAGDRSSVASPLIWRRPAMRSRLSTWHLQLRNCPPSSI